MFFLVKYCKALEEGSFRSRSADFLWMLVFGATQPDRPCCSQEPRTAVSTGDIVHRSWVTRLS